MAWNPGPSYSSYNNKTSGTAAMLTSSVTEPAETLLVFTGACDNSGPNSAPNVTMSAVPAGETRAWRYAYHNLGSVAAGNTTRGWIAYIRTSVDWNGHTLNATLSAAVTAKYSRLHIFYGGLPGDNVAATSQGFTIGGTVSGISLTAPSANSLMIGLASNANAGVPTSLLLDGVTYTTLLVSGNTTGGNTATNMGILSGYSLVAAGSRAISATCPAGGGVVAVAFPDGLPKTSIQITRAVSWNTARATPQPVTPITRATSWDTREMVTGVEVPTIGANLVTGTNSTFESGIGNWDDSAGGITTTISTVRAHSGSQSMLATWGGGGGNPRETLTLTVIPGATYVFSAWLYVPTGSPAVTLVVGDSSAPYGPYFGTDRADCYVKDAWTRVSLTFVANSTTCALWVWGSNNGVPGAQTWIDDVAVYEAAVPRRLAWDDFTGPDSTTSAWNPPVGPGRTWPLGGITWGAGADAVTWGISGNRLTNYVMNGALWANPGLTDFDLTLQVDTGPSMSIALAVKSKDNGSNEEVVLIYPVGASGWRIVQNVGHVAAQDHQNVGSPTAANTTYYLRLRCAGNQLSFYVNGVLGKTIPLEPQVAPGTWIGLINGTPPSGYWDNISVTPLALVADHFTGADSTTSLNGRVAPTGQTWQLSGGNAYGITGNRAYMTSSGGSAWIETNEADGIAEVDLYTGLTGPGGPDRPSLLLRADATTNNYITFRAEGTGSWWYLGQATGGGFSNIEVSNNTGVTWAQNTWYRLKAIMQGTTITCYVNGVLAIPPTVVPQHATNTKVGIAGNRTDQLYDNFSFTLLPQPITRGPTTWKIFGPPPSISRGTTWNINKPSVTITRATTWDALTIVRPTRNLLSQADSTMEASIASNAELTVDPVNTWVGMPFSTAWTWNSGPGTMTHAAITGNGQADLSRNSGSPILRPATTPDEFIVRISITLANQMKVVFGVHVGMAAIDASQGEFWKPAGSKTYKKELILPAGTSTIEYPVNVAATPVGTYPYISPYVSPIYDTIYTMGVITLESMDLLSGSVAGWAAFGPGHTIAPSSTQVNSGPASMKIAWSGGGGVPYVRTNPATAGFVVGQRYTMTAKVYLESGPPIGVGCESAANGPTTAIIGSWQPVAHSWVATATTHRPVINQGSSTTAGVTYVDNVVVGEAGTIERGTTWAVRPPPPTITRSTTWNAKGQPIATRSTTWRIKRLVGYFASVYDDFTAANSATGISNGETSTRSTPVGGLAWFNDNANTWGIGANQALTNGGGYLTCITTLADGVIEADVNVGASHGLSGIAFRVLSAASNMKFLISGSGFDLYKAIGNVGTLLSRTGSPATNTTYRLRVEFSGTSVSAFVDGVLQAQVTVSDAVLLDRARHGFYAQDGTTTTRWDNFAVSPAGDRAPKGTSWNIKQPLTKVLGQTTWRTKYALTLIGGRSTSWKARQAVALTRTTTWDAVKTLVQAKSTTWDSRTPVVITRITQGGGGQYLADVLSDAPIGYWRVGEATTAGGAADASGNGYVGTYVGDPVLGVPGLLTGDSNTAMSVTAVPPQGVWCDNQPAFRLDGNLTLEAWIKTSSPGGAGTYTTVAVKQFAYGMFLLDGVLISYEWGTSSNQSSGVNVADGVRHHLVVVYGANQEVGGSQFFVDGAPVGSPFFHHMSNTNSTPLEIGYNAGGQGINAVLDEVALYDKKLAPARIASHHAKGTAAGGGGWRVKQAVTLTRGTTWKVITLLPSIDITRSTTWKVRKQVGYSLVLVADDFTGPDNPTSIWNGTSLRSTPIGNLPWVGGGGATWGISAGRAVSSPTDGSLTLDPGTPDGVLEATIRMQDYAVSGFNLRRTDGSNQLRIFARFDFNSWSMAKFVAGAQTYQVATAADGLVTPNSTYRVRVVMNGPTIDLYVDNAFIWSYAITDPVLLTGQRIGICQTTSGSPDASWDNFSFTALPVRQANWDSRAPVVATRSSTWKIERQVQVTRSVSWRTLEFNVINRVKRVATWNVNTPVTILRPDAGPAPWSPSEITGLATWIDGATYAGTVTNKASGPALTMQGTPAMAVGQALNGLPTIRFKTNEGRVRSTWPSSPVDFTLVYLMRWIGPGIGRAFSTQYPPSNFLIGTHTSQPDTHYNNGTWLTSGTSWGTWGAGPGPWRMYGADSTSVVGSRFFIDGLQIGAGVANVGAQEGLYNGWGLSGYGAGNEETLDIEVAELLLYDHRLTDPERIQVEEYLTLKWLGAGLPGGAGGWNIRKAITLARPVSWNVASPKVPVQISRGSTWNIQGRIQHSRSTTWDARVAITRTRVITWDVTGAMAKTLGQTTWKIRAAPTITRPTSWDVLSSRTITRGSTTWRVKAEVAKTRVVTWNTIGLLVQITKVRSTTWKVTGRPVVTRATSWDVTTATTKALSSTTWKIKQAVGPTRVTSWDTLARTNTIIKGAAWDYRFAITVSKVATWDTRAVTTGTRVVSWDDLGRVTAVTRSSTWKIRAFAYTTRMATWDTRRAVGPTPNTTWRIVRPTSTSRSTTWRARRAILAARTVSWDSRAAKVLTRPTTWKVRFGVTSHPLGWVVDWADNPIQLWVGGVQTQVQIFNRDVATQAYLAATGLPISYAPALDGLVRGLKSYGLWTKMNAIYPFIGGTAALHKWNLKDPRDLDAAYRLTYSGGTHSTALGWRPNLTGNTYGNKANSYLVPLGTLSQDSTHMSMYSLLNTAPDDRCEMGAYNWGGGQERFNLIAMYNGGVFYYDMAANAGTNAPVPAASGLFVSTRTGSTAQSAYRNGAVVASSAAPSIPLPPIQLCVGGLNGYDQGPSNLCFGFASIGSGLSSTDNANLYNVVQAYQTALGRNI